MRVLAACEESQAVCKAFRQKGHQAYSLDLLPCSGGHPEWHIQQNVFPEMYRSHWDRIISFPPCTDLAVSGARWFQEKRANGSQEKAINFFFEVWENSDVTENPIGIMNSGDYIKKWFPKTYDRLVNNGFPFRPSQIIQPWQFGHQEFKATCLWIKEACGLPLLKPTNVLQPPMPYSKMTQDLKRKWGAVHQAVPGAGRSMQRSKTYEGIAAAMAEQWGVMY